MSEAAYKCEGIGVEASDIESYIDPIKLAHAIALYTDKNPVEDGLFDPAGEFMEDEEGRLEFLRDYLSDHWLSIITQADPLGALEYCNDFDTRDFLLFPTSYPWYNPGRFTERKQVEQYIANVVKPFCAENTSAESILLDIDEYSEIGTA